MSQEGGNNPLGMFLLYINFQANQTLHQTNLTILSLITSQQIHKLNLFNLETILHNRMLEVTSKWVLSRLTNHQSLQEKVTLPLKCSAEILYLLLTISQYQAQPVEQVQQLKINNLLEETNGVQVDQEDQGFLIILRATYSQRTKQQQKANLKLKVVENKSKI